MGDFCPIMYVTISMTLKNFLAVTEDIYVRLYIR